MFTPIQAQTQVCFALYVCLYYHENDYLTNFAHTSMKPLIYRKKPHPSCLRQGENVCIFVCVCDDIFRFQGQGVFPLSLSIVPAATVILRERSSHQDCRAAANYRAGQSDPEADGN